MPNSGEVLHNYDESTKVGPPTLSIDDILVSTMIDDKPKDTIDNEIVIDDEPGHYYCD